MKEKIKDVIAKTIIMITVMAIASYVHKLGTLGELFAVALCSYGGYVMGRAIITMQEIVEIKGYKFHIIARAIILLLLIIFNILLYFNTPDFMKAVSTAAISGGLVGSILKSLPTK
jgi:uncharacterized BrkB/YihY/UPF0761 family membrane protein